MEYTILLVISIINYVRSNSTDHLMAAIWSPVLVKNVTNLADTRPIVLGMELTPDHNGKVCLKL